MENGWVKLHRKLLDSPLMTKPTYFLLWSILLLKANHKDKKMIWNNDVIVIHEGQLVTGRKELSKLTKIPETTIEDILNFLEKQGNIRQQKTTKFRLITILNWKNYQSSDNKATTKRQQSDTNKNVKKDKNDKNTSETSSQPLNDIIKAFEEIDAKNKTYYGNKTQRSACQFLIDTYGLEQVLMLIPKLKETNSQSVYQITTPWEMKEKVTKVFNDLKRKKVDIKSKAKGFA